MSRETRRCDSFPEAMKTVNALLSACRERGIDPLQTEVGEHLNPGDVYDAYEAIGMEACEEDVLEQTRCGAFAAVILQRRFPDRPADWQSVVAETFDPDYAEGFRHGYALRMPERCGNSRQDVYYIRGLYDGVMSNAAVF